MSDNFQLVKDAVDIIDVAEHYGISVNHSKKAHCPWHDDKTPSLSFKNQRFKCFGCNVGGDVIDLVKLLAGAQTPLDAVREINHTFRLGFDLDKPVPSDAIQLRKLIQERKRRFEVWERNTVIILNAYFRFLRDCLTTYAPRHPDEELHYLFVEALHKLDYIENVLDMVFIEGNRDTKMWFFVSHAGIIRSIEQRLIQEMVSYADRNEGFYHTDAAFMPVVVAGCAQERVAA